MNPEEKLSPHFKLGEFLHEGSFEGVTPYILKNLKRIAEALEGVRKLHGNAPIHITSGYRTPIHNKEVGGASRSWHLQGRAADFVVEGFTPQQTQAILKDWPGGLEYAKEWTHCDLGPHRRFYP